MVHSLAIDKLGGLHQLPFQYMDVQPKMKKKNVIYKYKIYNIQKNITKSKSVITKPKNFKQPAMNLYVLLCFTINAWLSDDLLNFKIDLSKIYLYF